MNIQGTFVTVYIHIIYTFIILFLLVNRNVTFVALLGFLLMNRLFPPMLLSVGVGIVTRCRLGNRGVGA
jgi:hypothetical protein